MAGATGIVIGHCRLEQEIGRGGAGTVYRARQLGVNRAVAVKLIPLTHDRVDTTERFEREASAAGRLDHPHCLPVYAAGEQDGLLYLVMRLVDGPDLAHLIQRDGPLEPARAVALLEQIASAVDYAHGAGLVHRDLKPGNILIEPDGGVGHAWVSDFGLMRSLGDFPITMTGQWVGTPQFAAPEQQRGERVGPAADIYALGGVLAQALGPTPPSGLVPVLKQAMHHDPASRYPSAGALARAANAALTASGDRPTRTLATRVRTADTFEASTRRVAPVRESSPRRGRVWARRAVALGCVSAMVAAVAVAAVLVLNSHRPRKPRRVASTGTRTASRSTTTGVRGKPFSVGAYTATIPSTWKTVVRDVQKTGYTASEVESPDGRSRAFIDDNPLTSVQSLHDDFESVQSAAARVTADYQVLGVTNTTLGGTNAIIWSFSGDDSYRVDVFRQVGQQVFAVLGVSQSSSQSNSIAVGIAQSIELR